MDMGADDLLPREDMQHTTEDVETASEAIVLTTIPSTTISTSSTRRSPP